MTQSQFVRRVLKPAVFVAALVPGAWLVRDTMVGALSANPIEDITHRTGLASLRFLLITLAVTPLRQWLGIPSLITLRRMLGLFAFFYAVVHFSIYMVFDHFFSLATILEDIAKRPYITVGFTAFVLLIPLAVTSTKKMIKRLGGKRWSRLHQLIYVAAAGGVIHYLWLVKADTRSPVVYGMILVALLVARLVRRTRGGAAPVRRGEPRPTPATTTG